MNPEEIKAYRGCVVNFMHGGDQLTIWASGGRFRLEEFGLLGAVLPMTYDPVFQSIATEILRLGGEIGKLRRAEIERGRERCAWTEDFDGHWQTACGSLHTFTAGGPGENGHRFCPYCARAIAPKAYVAPPVCFLCGEGADYGVEPSEEGRPLLARQEVDGRYLFHEDCAADPEPADTGGGYEPVDDGDVPEF